jgi:hypothetical protein
MFVHLNVVRKRSPQGDEAHKDEAEVEEEDEALQIRCKPSRHIMLAALAWSELASACLAYASSHASNGIDPCE